MILNLGSDGGSPVPAPPGVETPESVIAKDAAARAIRIPKTGVNPIPGPAASKAVPADALPVVPGAERPLGPESRAPASPVSGAATEHPFRTPDRFEERTPPRPNSRPLAETSDLFRPPPR